MKFSLPFIPDMAYADFLAGHDTLLASLYFPAASGPVFDARVSPGLSGQALAAALAPLGRVKKYILINTRFVAPRVYSQTRELTRFLDGVAEFDRTVGINGLVACDAYLIHALDRTGHPLIPRLELVPGVNAMLDSMEKIDAFMEIIGQTRFRPPSRLVPDRSLNRDPKRLSALYRKIKSAYPGVHVEVLANEGCILHCPFKPAHDAHIGLSNTGLVREATWEMNRTLGCQAYYAAHPHRIFKSPFIRPEDLDRYQGMADGIKICGRTLGPNFLTRCLRAYRDRAYGGNLLDLMDTPSDLAQRIHISNPDLGPDFFTTLTTCTKDCKPCRICRTLFQETAVLKPVTLNRFKDIQ